MGGTIFTTIQTHQQVRIRVVHLSDSQEKACVQFESDVGYTIFLERRSSKRQPKDMRCVVFCSPKDYEATGRTHLGRFNRAQNPIT